MTNNSKHIFIPLEMCEPCEIRSLNNDHSKVLAQDAVDTLHDTVDVDKQDPLALIRENEELTEKEKIAAEICFICQRNGNCLIRFYERM